MLRHICHTPSSPPTRRLIAGAVSCVAPSQVFAHTSIALDAPPFLLAGAVTLGVLGTLALCTITQRRRTHRQMLNDAHSHHAVSASLADTVIDDLPRTLASADAMALGDAAPNATADF
ncbi:MAG TPA: hypothetical protein PLC58_17390, partial [Denitromonas sp.]|nr:hypothetical protein [Denitromonas sp.]